MSFPGCEGLPYYYIISHVLNAQTSSDLTFMFVSQVCVDTSEAEDLCVRH